ncbi:MAG: bifunctional (p)ppGpp synthetase/guanosine-3',5'-bis(diphosphate) 3'-pyrophosphohydrolase [Pseudomonadales bacterium]|nr:bifunctional (p)ppGpp synthetase/guanosine-3',5'-bis(diphosphate) 3'-pyrophosphohydrolase [Pseudomonadales bacterium]
MVKVREQQPLEVDGSVNLELWLCKLNERNPEFNLSRLREVCDLSQQAEEKAIATNTIWAPGHSSFRIGLEMADILTELHMDEDGVVAAIIYRAVRENQITLNHVRKQFGDTVAELVHGVLRMAAISNIRFGVNERVLGERKDQLEQARRLLVSLVDDVRVALIKLAERTCAIRTVAKANEEKRVRLAREVFDIYAPLAHRLGIGHLKWELEDIAFRYLEPDAYKRIASLLDEKRGDREKYIEKVITLLSGKLREVSIEAEIKGRAKHIYSIWRKMKEKGISFAEVYDVRAVRILVRDINACYGVLGIVHTLWRNIPREFDDYIAAPKENGYRSLHTAVIGPEGKVLEVQIRTSEMHEEAELGVCSHWRYKGSGDDEEPVAYGQRIEWMRQLLEWQEEFSDVSGLTKELFSEVSLDRIYVFTPDGHVVDMPPGSTPVDFAYRVHTEVGHKCRGVKINSRVRPLNTTLATGDQVEIILGEEAEPRREWLHVHLGYVTTSRARAKIKAWFGHRARRKNIEEGMRLLDDELTHLGIDHVDKLQVASQAGYDSCDAMYEAIGSGELELLDVLDQVASLVQLDLPGQQLSLVLSDAEGDDAESPIAGIGELGYRIAECCNPVPGDAIVGVIDEHSFVLIHKQDCLKALRADIYGHLMRLDWKQDASRTFPVDIEVAAYDRSGLLYDITGIFMHENINVIRLNSVTNKHTSRVDLKMVIEVSSLNSLLTSLERIEQLSNVMSARRVASD